MRVYHCDGPNCDAKCSPDIQHGWSKIKLYNYSDCSFHTGWLKCDTLYFCPECSHKLDAFINPVGPNTESIDLTDVEPVATGTFEPKKEVKHYDKGYIWE